jgi:DNA-binding response OmpR family regulator
MDTILLIEDHQLIRDNICEILEVRSYKVVVAMDGQSGLEIAKQMLPALIICDVRIPILNGYEVLKQIRNDSEVSHLPFFLMSAIADEYEINAGLRLGATEFITKPFEPEILIKKISFHLDKKR